MREREVVPGLTVSVVGVGTNNFGWRLDEPAGADVVDAAIEAGITLFDTAESYGDGAERGVPRPRDRAAAATAS